MSTATAKRPTAKRARAAEPAPPPAPTTATWEFRGGDANDFCRRVRAVAIAASTDDGRLVLTALHVRSDGRQVRLEATDSYRLYRLDFAAELPAVDVLIPAAFLARNLPKRVGLTETLTLRFAERFAIEFDGETYARAPLGGPYPDTDKLMAQCAVEAGGHEVVKAYNPRNLVDIYKAAHLAFPDTAVKVKAGLDPIKPTVFEVSQPGAELTMVLMPVRLP